MRKLIEECYNRSIELLANNATEYGFLAAFPSKIAKKRHYASIFTRDASVCSLAALASGNRELLEIAKSSLSNLARFQTIAGQIPNYVQVENKMSDFWALSSIDANLWWLIATKKYLQTAVDKKTVAALKSAQTKAIDWLTCHEHPEDNLLVQCEAGDWADIFPRNGRVLYSNALWCHVKKIYGMKTKSNTQLSFNNIFLSSIYHSKRYTKNTNTTVEALRREEAQTNNYISYVSYMYWGKDVDVFGSALALSFFLSAPNARQAVIADINKRVKLKGMPVPVLFNPIKQNSREWRPYMTILGQNQPFQYQNGGIWPFAACFWAIALERNGLKKEADRELGLIAKANSLNNWEFNEWFHGQSKKAMGMKKQSWNAGAFILAYHCIYNNFEF